MTNDKPGSKKLVERGIKNTKLKKKLGEICVYCGSDNKLIQTIDHIISITRGGEDTEQNKQVACVFCNWLKGGLTDKEFKKYYKALMAMKDLNKMKFVTGEFKIFFSPFGHPKDLKDLEETDESR